MWRRIIKPAFEKILNAVYPPRCPLCDEFVSLPFKPCPDCEASINRLDGNANFPFLPKNYFERCRSCFSYEGKVKDALHNFKYAERMDLARFFGDELSALAKNMGDFDLIMPVPLSPARLKNRGFNQAALLVCRVSKLIYVPADLYTLKRVRHVKPQVGLERSDRLDNVKGAFGINEKRRSNLTDKKILLIDDIVTTGATVNECAKVLTKSGANAVSILSIARTL